MAKSSMSDLIVEGVSTTTVPGKVTDPRLSYKVSILNGAFDTNHGVLQTRMHMVLCYEKLHDDDGDSGWHVGGWIKETLGKALQEDPILAGRLVRCEDGGLEIVSNDSGVRVVEARISLSLAEFLESKEKDQIKTELVSWKDVDESNPQFSPLYYIQVTNFQCGGYSLGISCSLLLADPFLMVKFFNTWSEIHKNTGYEGEIPKTPLFYAPNFAKRVGCPPPSAITAASNPSWANSKTAIFDISIDEKLDSRDEICNHVVYTCIEEAEDKFGLKMGPTFVLITKKPNGDTKAEKSSKEGSFGSLKSLKYEINSSNWEELGANKITFRRDNLPIEVSHWVARNDLEGVVLVVVSSPWKGKYGMKVYVTFPRVNGLH